MDLRQLALRPAVQKARARVVACDEATFQEQLRIVAIPAPSFFEAARAEFVGARLRQAGLDAVAQDAVGNLLGLLPRPVRPDAAPVVVAAHLDTVFAGDVEVTPRVHGLRVYAPGIADNARGLAAMLTLARVLAELGIRTLRPLWFAGTVGEEGNGDLRGVKHLFRPGSGFAGSSAFVSLDGSGLRRIVHRAIGARRLRITVAGPGGHSWADWGAVNPIHALGEAVAALRRMAPPVEPPTTLTVARFSGGTSINVIPSEAWMEVDLRSEDPAALARLEAEVRVAIEAAVEAENAGRRGSEVALRCRVECIGDRPAGAVSQAHPVVRAALAATRLVGARPELTASSTDANVPIARGIPAVTLGAGGESGGIHTTGEWYTNRDAARGVERALLTILAVTGLADG